MTLVLKGVMQSPVTPLKEDFSPDYETFEKLVDFHVRTGATAISWPHHKAESHNLTITERKALAEVAIKTVAKRVPISIHVSALALEDTYDLARHAQKAGADAIIAITPYFWKYPPEAIYDYFVDLGTSIDLPLIAYNSPSYLDGIEFTGELTARLIQRLPNLVGMKEASFNSEKFFEILRAALPLRPELRDDRRRRISVAFGVAWRRRLLFFGGRHLSQSLRRTCTNVAPAANGRARASCNTSCRSSGCCSATSIHPRSRAAASSWADRSGRRHRRCRPLRRNASNSSRQQLEALGILDSEPHGW